MQHDSSINYLYNSISKQIKPDACIDTDMNELIELGLKMLENPDHKVSSRCRTGNNVVDHFTFEERLKTKGKYNVNFYEFVERIKEFKEKKFIQNMLTYYENVKNKNKQKTNMVVLKEVYNICISAINIFRPLVAMELYAIYKPKHVLDFCAGWGGRCVGACALNVPKYTGIDINKGLQYGYDKMTTFLKTKSTTEIDMYFQDAISFDYSILEYDFVLTSPPYYFIEKYPNNAEYKNKQVMNKLFYIPLFERTFKFLQVGGIYCLNVNSEIYDAVCLPLLGECEKKIPLKKSKRQNEYGEFIYIWTKLK
jgi:hypothetical protein